MFDLRFAQPIQMVDSENFKRWSNHHRRFLGKNTDISCCSLFFLFSRNGARGRTCWAQIYWWIFSSIATCFTGIHGRPSWSLPFSVEDGYVHCHISSPQRIISIGQEYWSAKGPSSSSKIFFWKSNNHNQCPFFIEWSIYFFWGGWLQSPFFPSISCGYVATFPAGDSDNGHENHRYISWPNKTSTWPSACFLRFSGGSRDVSCLGVFWGGGRS